MDVTLRPLQIPADFPALAALFNQWEHEPTTAARLEEAESEWPSGGHLLRLVAVDDQDRLLGYLEAMHFDYMKPGKFQALWLVDQADRGQGIGRMLASAMESFVREHGGDLIEASVRDDDERSRQILEAHGYKYERHVYESRLDLATFDDSPYAGVIDGVEASGIQFFTLADRPGEATVRAMYELMNANVVDIPGWDSPSHPSFEDWSKWFITSSESRHDCVIIAADGDRFVGLTVLFFKEETGAMYTGHTSVSRDYRGRKLALALKLLSIRKAKAYGAPYMRTHNDSVNQPMLAVNWKLGYVKEPGIWRFRKTL